VIFGNARAAQKQGDAPDRQGEQKNAAIAEFRRQQAANGWPEEKGYQHGVTPEDGYGAVKSAGAVA
jgi:hypothetical protein